MAFGLPVGRPYALLLAPILALGLHMIVKGQLSVVRLQHFLGRPLTALTSPTACQPIYRPGTTAAVYFSMTYQIFRNETDGPSPFQWGAACWAMT